MLDFLKSKGDFVELAVQHVGTSAIMDLLLRLICNVEEDEIRQSVHQVRIEASFSESISTFPLASLNLTLATNGSSSDIKSSLTCQNGITFITLEVLVELLFMQQ